jgi:hypothetical protein
VIAEYLRLRAHRLRPATPFTAETTAVRTVVRTRDDIVEMRALRLERWGAGVTTHTPSSASV